MEHFRKLERMYHTAPINGWFQPVLRVGDGEAEIQLPLRPEFHHSAGATHGSLYFKAMDDAAFFAANSLVEDVFVLTATFELAFLKPVVDGTLCAKARVSGEDTTRIYAEVDLLDSKNRLIGKGKGSFARSTIALSTVAEYR